MTTQLLLPRMTPPRALLAATLRDPEPAWSYELVDAHPLAGHVFSERGTITRTNAAFDALFRAPRGRYVGRHQAALNVFSVEANIQLLQEIRAAVDTRGIWEGTLLNRRGDGVPFTTRAQIHPMQVDGGRCLVCFQKEETHGHHATA